MFVEILGERLIERKLKHVAATRANMMRILGGPVADVIFDIEEQIFNSQGRRGGGSWAGVTPGWFRRKVELGLDPRIGHASLSLRRAMTERNAKHQKLRVTSQSLTLGTDLPYADVQQENRPFVKFTPTDKREIGQLIRQELVAAYRGMR